MSDTTFQGYVEKKNLQFKDQKNIEEQKNEAFYLEKTAAEYKDDIGYDAGGYSRNLVNQAASFILKTNQYGLSAKSLDVSDSPIYYKMEKGKKCARGYFDRKKLTKAGNRLIDLAKKRQKENADMLIQEELSFNEETWKPAETPQGAPPSEADNVIDRLITDGTIENVDQCVREEMQEKDDSVHFFQKRTYEAMDDKSKLPDFNQVVSNLNVKMLHDLQFFVTHGKKVTVRLPKRNKI